MDNMYFDFAQNIRKKLCNDLNGRIIFEIYSHIDTVIFKIYFKEFDFSYAVNNVQDRIYSGTVDEIPEDFKRDYMKAIRNAFFKTENHKKRDELVRMGVEA